MAPSVGEDAGNRCPLGADADGRRHSGQATWWPLQSLNTHDAPPTFTPPGVHPEATTASAHTKHACVRVPSSCLRRRATWTAIHLRTFPRRCAHSGAPTRTETRGFRQGSSVRLWSGQGWSPAATRPTIAVA